MGKFIIGQGTGNKVTVNGVDLTSHVSSVDTDKSADDHDVTGFGAEVHEHLLGLGEHAGTLNFWQDFDAASVDDTLDELQGENEAFPVVVEAGGNTWTLEALLPNYKPLSGAVGEPSATECSFLCGDGVGWVKT
jgi:hypothetical protein